MEVSGFGSSRSGHLNLLRLNQQVPDGGNSTAHWPTLGLNTLRWAKRQGAICGPAHSGFGLTNVVDRVPGTEGRDGPGGLPTFNLPAFDGIGANEFIMDVAHQVPGPDGKLVPAVDFISAMNSDRTAEWNIWYHVLNCGFRVKVSGETDFPCLTGSRVGLGRVYVKLDGELDYNRWVEGLAAGRSYVSDGRTQLMDFTGTAAAQPGLKRECGTGDSELQLAQPGRVSFSVTTAALDPAHKTLPVELVVNGFPVARQEIATDGRTVPVAFSHTFERSSWAAVRIFPGGHSNPIFVIVNQRPIRASALSAEWCLRSIDICWKSKSPAYHIDERNQAAADYETARDVFRKILQESH